MEATSCLEKLRIFDNFRDEAVKIIGDRTILNCLFICSDIHKREEFIQAVLSTYSGEAYGEHNWTKVYEAWGESPRKVTLNGIFAEQCPGLSQLNLDPGFMTHLPEFLEFIKTNPIKSPKNALETRAEFKEHLGSRIVYRGMVLSDEEAEAMRYEGIQSAFFRTLKGNISPTDYFEANFLTIYLDKIIEKQFYHENKYSPLISVTSHEDVAISVAKHFGRTWDKKDKKLYLFKIKIPEIDLIYCTDHGVMIPGKLKESIDRGINLRVILDDKEYFHPWDRHIESYVMHKIDADEIIEVITPEVKESLYKGQYIREN